MDCEFSDAKKGSACSRCGWKLPRDYDNSPHRNCKGPPGIGDRIAKLLTVVGITEARWLALKGIVVESPTCGCGKRIEKLNRWGRWLNRFGRWLASWRKPLRSSPPGE